MGPAPSGLTPAIVAMPDKEERIVARRLREHEANMRLCVEGIRALAEQALAQQALAEQALAQQAPAEGDPR